MSLPSSRAALLHAPLPERARRSACSWCCAQPWAGVHLGCDSSQWSAWLVVQLMSSNWRQWTKRCENNTHTYGRYGLTKAAWTLSASLPCQPSMQTAMRSARSSGLKTSTSRCAARLHEPVRWPVSYISTIWHCYCDCTGPTAPSPGLCLSLPGPLAAAAASRCGWGTARLITTRALLGDALKAVMCAIAGLCQEGPEGARWLHSWPGRDDPGA